MSALSDERIQSLHELEKCLGYSFTDLTLLHEATCHNSWLFDGATRSGASYERMEFLGDTIFSFIVGEYLFRSYPLLTEADYSRVRSRVGSGENLNQVGTRLRLGEFILLSRGEESSHGRKKKSIVSSVVEAIIAAVHIDSGIEEVKRIFLPMVVDQIDYLARNPHFRDCKTLLQEYSLKKYNKVPLYRVVIEEGPAHDRQYRVNVSIEDGRNFEGTGGSKKEAQKNAARLAVSSIDDIMSFFPSNRLTPDSCATTSDHENPLSNATTKTGTDVFPDDAPHNTRFFGKESEEKDAC